MGDGRPQFRLILSLGCQGWHFTADLGLARNTVCRFARADDPEQLLVHDGTGHQPSILDQHTPTCTSGGTTAAPTPPNSGANYGPAGYPGGYSRVRDYLASFRGAVAAPAPTPQPPKVNKSPAGSSPTPAT